MDRQNDDKKQIPFWPHPCTMTDHTMPFVNRGARHPWVYFICEFVDNSIESITTANREHGIDGNVEVCLFKSNNGILQCIGIKDNGGGVPANGFQNWAKLAQPKERMGTSSESAVEAADSQDKHRVTGHISRYGKGAKIAGFSLGSGLRMISKGVKDSSTVNALLLSAGEMKRKNEAGEDWAKATLDSFEVGQLPSDLKYYEYCKGVNNVIRQLGQDEETFSMSLVSDLHFVRKRDSFPEYLFRTMDEKVVHTAKERMETADWYINKAAETLSNRLAHIYHYYLDAMPNLSISVSIYEADGTQGDTYICRELEDSYEQVLLNRACASPLPIEIPLPGRVDRGERKIHAVLRYYSRENSGETLPLEDFEEEKGGNQYMFECFWNGRLIPFAQGKGVKTFERQKSQIPPECFKRIRGQVFLDDRSRVADDKQCMQMEVETLFEDAHSSRHLRNKFLEWMKKQHEKYDNYVTLDGFIGELRTKDEMKYTWNSITIYNKQEDDQVFERGQTLTYKEKGINYLCRLERIIAERTLGTTRVSVGSAKCEFRLLPESIYPTPITFTRDAYKYLGMCSKQTLQNFSYLDSLKDCIVNWNEKGEKAELDILDDMNFIAGKHYWFKAKLISSSDKSVSNMFDLLKNVPKDVKATDVGKFKVRFRHIYETEEEDEESADTTESFMWKATCAGNYTLIFEALDGNKEVLKTKKYDITVKAGKSVKLDVDTTKCDHFALLGQEYGPIGISLRDAENNRCAYNECLDYPKVSLAKSGGSSLTVGIDRTLPGNEIQLYLLLGATTMPCFDEPTDSERVRIRIIYAGYENEMDIEVKPGSFQGMQVKFLEDSHEVMSGENFPGIQILAKDKYKNPVFFPKDAFIEVFGPFPPSKHSKHLIKRKGKKTIKFHNLGKCHECPKPKTKKLEVKATSCGDVDINEQMDILMNSNSCPKKFHVILNGKEVPSSKRKGRDALYDIELVAGSNFPSMQVFFLDSKSHPAIVPRNTQFEVLVDHSNRKTYHSGEMQPLSFSDIFHLWNEPNIPGSVDIAHRPVTLEVRSKKYDSTCATFKVSIITGDPTETCIRMYKGSMDVRNCSEMSFGIILKDKHGNKCNVKGDHRPRSVKMFLSQEDEAIVPVENPNIRKLIFKAEEIQVFMKVVAKAGKNLLHAEVQWKHGEKLTSSKVEINVQPGEVSSFKLLNSKDFRHEFPSRGILPPFQLQAQDASGNRVDDLNVDFRSIIVDSSDGDLIVKCDRKRYVEEAEISKYPKELAPHILLEGVNVCLLSKESKQINIEVKVPNSSINCPIVSPSLQHEPGTVVGIALEPCHIELQEGSACPAIQVNVKTIGSMKEELMIRKLKKEITASCGGYTKGVYSDPQLINRNCIEFTEITHTELKQGSFIANAQYNLRPFGDLYSAEWEATVVEDLAQARERSELEKGEEANLQKKKQLQILEKGIKETIGSLLGELDNSIPNYNEFKFKFMELLRFCITRDDYARCLSELESSTPEIPEHVQRGTDTLSDMGFCGTNDDSALISNYLGWKMSAKVVRKEEQYLREFEANRPVILVSKEPTAIYSLPSNLRDKCELCSGVLQYFNDSGRNALYAVLRGAVITKNVEMALVIIKFYTSQNLIVPDVLCREEKRWIEGSTVAKPKDEIAHSSVRFPTVSDARALVLHKCRRILQREESGLLDKLWTKMESLQAKEPTETEDLERPMKRRRVD